MKAQIDAVRPEEGATFQRRIAGVALVTSAAVLLGACLAFVAQQWSGERRALIQHHATLAQVVAPSAADDISEGRPYDSAALVRSLAKANDVRAVYLLDPKGRVLAADSEHAPLGDGPPTVREHASQTRVPLSTRDGRPLGQLVIVADMGQLTPIVARYLAVSMMLFFAASGLAMFLSHWLAARLIRPVNDLSMTMLELADSGDVTRRAPHVEDPVFARLTTSFNHLLDQLQLKEQKLRHTLRDLTVARDAAETANVLKSQFLANMSHEIRTPLNGVLAMAQLMERSSLDSGQRERLAVIRGSGEALLTVLNDVLDLSKIEAGKLELEEADFDIGELARGLEQTFEPQAKSRGLAFSMDVAPAAAGVRRGDRARLQQILNNLMSNALKFTQEGAVAVRFEGLGEGGQDGFAVSITDTGMGIPEDKLPLLFEKFAQVDNSNTRRFGGTGLGLAICRELATLMGGRVGVRSTLGQGSTFRLELPFARVGEALPAPEPERPAVVEDEEEPAAVRILAAEDNATNQRVLRAVLDTFGVDVDIVENGKLAVEAWAGGDYDVILMDIQMPEMDGVEATKAIRAAERIAGRPRTPIVALSANAMTHQVSEYLAAGMDAHVAKPIEIVRLQAAIEAALEMDREVELAA